MIVTSYENPDLDGFACTLAYAEFLQKQNISCTGRVFGTPTQEARWVTGRFNIAFTKEENVKKNEQVILVDASDTKGISKKINPLYVIEIIDHRQINEVEKFPHAKKQIEFVGSAATLIAEKFSENNISPSKQSSILLHTAIISNTLNFKAKVTTDRDRKMATWLMQFSTLSPSFAREMFLAKSDMRERKLEEEMSRETARFTFGNQEIGIVQLEMIGAEELSKTREKDIETILQKQQEKYALQYIFLTIIDVEKGYNIFFAKDSKIKRILENIFHIRFKENTARTKEVILRKEIVPKIKEHFI